jgi:MFS family permease
VPAILAEPATRALDLPRSWFFAAFSLALLIAAFLGPRVGRIIDRHGGRGVLVISNLVIAGGLLVLAAAQGVVTMFIAWAILGVGMALGLYDAAFATLTAYYGREARSPITGITLFAGFASTVSWPVSALLNDAFGWREACIVWAALNLLVALPLNRFVLPAIDTPASSAATATSEPIGWSPLREMFLLAFVFAAGWLVAGAMGAHLPALLERAGASPVEAIAAAALVGPAQVAARIGEFALLRRVHPLVSARISTLLHPIGAAALAVLGAPGAALFALFFGAGNGLLTIARGTVPLALFGPVGYGERSGLLGAPARITQAFAPLAFGLLMDAIGVAVIAVSAGLCLAALAALLMLRIKPVDN